VKRNDIFIVKIWRNKFGKISTLVHHISNQDPTHAHDLKDINLSSPPKISRTSIQKGDKNSGSENLAAAEIKCSACGSTNLIKISDHSKAMLFLENMEENLEPGKIRSRRGKDKLITMWWCLDCKRLC
jgi:hypothetical protein